MLNFSKNIHRGFSANSISAGSCKEPIDNFYTRIAAEIVIAAVRDWRDLVKREAWDGGESKYCNFYELRQFFNSGWCAFLMKDFDIEPARILEILEAELQEAMRNAKPKANENRKGVKREWFY
jgi:hypothetical protein